MLSCRLSPRICLVAFLALSILACSDSHRPGNCISYCPVRSVFTYFLPELSYYHCDISQVLVVMENPAPTTDTKSHKSKEIKSLRILCFGDSLTAGYSSYGNLHYPYAAQIRKELKKAFPATNVNVVVSGLSGDRVLAGQYLRRMKGMCATDHYPPYDWIIVLGGTNDLGWDERPDKVYDALSW